MKKRLLIFLIPVFISVLLLLSGCDMVLLAEKIEIVGTDVPETEPGTFDYSGIEIKVTYSDGSSVVLPLTEDMIPEHEKLKFYKPGEQIVTVFYEGQTCGLKIKVNMLSFGENVTLPDATFVYDSKPHTVTVNGELPESAVVKYPNGNTFTEAGEYDVSAAVVCEGYETLYLSSKVTVKKADADVSSVIFEGGEYVYDGKPKGPAATGIPEGISAVYELYAFDGKTRLDEAVEAGTYVKKLRLIPKDANFNPIPDKTVTFTIKKDSYDLGGAVLPDAEFVYDGMGHTASLSDPSVLPKDVSVVYSLYYTGLGSREAARNADVKGLTKVLYAKNAGYYLLVASFRSSNRNFEEIPEMRSVITVEKAKIDTSSLSMDSFFCNYDGEKKTIKAAGNLPEGVKISYLYNGEPLDGVSASGTYSVDAVFIPDDAENYEAFPSVISASLIIGQINYPVEFSEENVIYDPENGYKVIGLEDGMKAVLEFSSDGSPVNASALERGEEYDYTAFFSFDDPDKQASLIVPEVSGTVRLRQPLTLPEVTFDSISVTYDGENHSVAVRSDGAGFPEDAFIYLGESAVNAGIYEAKASPNEREYIFTFTGTPISELRATIEIKKKVIDTSLLTLTAFDSVYDGNARSFAVSGDIPDGIRLEYSAPLSYVNAGSYSVTVTFVCEDAQNCVTSTPGLSGIGTISKCLIDTSALSLGQVDKVYDGEAVSVSVSGDIPDGVDIGYDTENSFTEPGEYQIKALISPADEDNYLVSVAELEGSVRIRKILYNLPEFTFADKTVTFDECEYSLDPVSGLPDCIDVTYSDQLTQYNAGTYKITAYFSHKDTQHYELDVEKAEATLKINKKAIDLKDDLGIDRYNEFAYNGMPNYVAPSLQIQGLYFSDNGKTDVGRYKLSVTFTNTNYVMSFYGEEGTSFTIYIYVKVSENNFVKNGNVLTVTGIGYYTNSFTATVSAEGMEDVVLSNNGASATVIAEKYSISGNVEYASYEYSYFYFSIGE